MRTEERDRIFLAVYAPLKPLVLSWVTAVLCATMAYVLEASSPSLGQTSWKDAARAGSSIWMLALGSPFTTGEATITLPPLLITALLTWWMSRELRRGVILEWKHAFISSLSALLGTAILGYFSLPGTLRPVGAVCCASVTFVLAAYARPHVRQGRVRAVLNETYAFFLPLLRALAVLALLVTLVALFAGRERIAAINGYYVLDVKSTLVFAFAQLLYAPTYLIWALSYMMGSGFSVGTGTLFSPFGVDAQALPALPVFGALPSPGTSAPWLPFLMALILCLWGVKRSRQFSNGRQALTVVSTMFAFVVLWAAGLGVIAGGSIAQGRMHTVGTNVGTTILAYSLVIGVGHGIGVIGPFAIRWLRRDLTGAPQKISDADSPSVSDAEDAVKAKVVNETSDEEHTSVAQTNGEDADGESGNDRQASPTSASLGGRAQDTDKIDTIIRDGKDDEATPSGLSQFSFMKENDDDGRTLTSDHHQGHVTNSEDSP